MEKDLHTTFSLLQKFCQAGNRRETNNILKDIKNNRHTYCHESIKQALTEEYADALYKSLLLELDEEEEESIEMAELAYMTICIQINSENVKPEHYKLRLLLLHYFSDYFTDSVIEIFLQKYRKDHLLQARKMALECIERMQLSDMFHLEENAPEFIEKDEQITDACNTIELDANFTKEEREEAHLLHQVLYAYLKNKYNSNRM